MLICGHSYVFWAAHRAGRSAFGTQLGLGRWADITWMGRQEMQWSGLLPLLFEEYKGPVPQVLMIHLGGNDLGLVKGKALVLQVTDDLHLISQRWPGVVIVWSAMIPRRAWGGASNVCAMDRARRGANREIRRVLQEGLGLYVPHPKIRMRYAKSLHLYRDDGVHLSEEGTDIFLSDLQQGLRAALGIGEEKGLS